MNSNHDAAWGFAEVETADEKKAREMFDLLWAERTSAEHDEIAALRASLVARDAELASYRTLPLVPARDHEIMRAQRDAFRDALAAAMDQLSRTAGGPSESAVFAHARGLLAEAGVVPASVEEYRRAFEEWELARNNGEIK